MLTNPRAAESSPFSAVATRLRWIFVPTATGLVLGAAGAGLLAAPKDPLSVPREKVLGTTTINAGPEMWAALTEFFTGNKDERSVVNILVGLYKGSGADRKLLSTRDYNEETGGFVSRGSLEIIDLDRDGTTEVLV